MPAADLTKKALSQALKELVNERHFAKISVGDICERCGMHRKSFYYHFRDKYDLVNWIFYTEFVSAMEDKDYTEKGQFLEDICNYFHQNRKFYANLLSLSGQNSFRDYFLEILRPLFMESLSEVMENDETAAFFTGFLSDAILMAMIRWLLTTPAMPPEKFVSLMHASVDSVAKHIAEHYRAE